MKKKLLATSLALSFLVAPMCASFAAHHQKCFFLTNSPLGTNAAVTKWLKDNCATTVGKEVVPAGTMDLTSYMMKIRSVNPDVIFASSKLVPVIKKNAKDFKISAPVETFKFNY